MEVDVEQLLGVGIEEGYQNLVIEAQNKNGTFEILIPYDQAVKLAQAIAGVTAHTENPIVDHKTGAIAQATNLSLEAKSIAILTSNDGKIGLSIQSAVGQIPPIVLPESVLVGLSKQLDAAIQGCSKGWLPGLPRGKIQ